MFLNEYSNILKLNTYADTSPFLQSLGQLSTEKGFNLGKYIGADFLACGVVTDGYGHVHLANQSTGGNKSKCNKVFTNYQRKAGGLISAFQFDQKADNARSLLELDRKKLK
jgi:hypothetical protein